MICISKLKVEDLEDYVKSLASSVDNLTVELNLLRKEVEELKKK